MEKVRITMEKGRYVSDIRGHEVVTGQGGPSPFELFIASLGACAAITIDTYCQQKNLCADGLTIDIEVVRNEQTRMADKLIYQYTIPRDFPQEDVPKIIRAANACFVKKHLAKPPQFETIIK